MLSANAPRYFYHIRVCAMLPPPPRLLFHHRRAATSSQYVGRSSFALTDDTGEFGKLVSSGGCGGGACACSKTDPNTRSESIISLAICTLPQNNIGYTDVPSAVRGAVLCSLTGRHKTLFAVAMTPALYIDSVTHQAGVRDLLDDQGET